ncbi:hypothetical protein E1301_Tti010284 [Triplophysa tibetana]|uniref:Fe2OG dioxygenase domain-containing protein n=1 Tax=Triplophysa tibetana TaxID=1572043 RepID=A0A5A9P2A3_9TELE|nr:hypothetical protein E1301_Tti010284 [Triplophysa tibetana]
MKRAIKTKNSFENFKRPRESTSARSSANVSDATPVPTSTAALIPTPVGEDGVSEGDNFGCKRQQRLNMAIPVVDFSVYELEETNVSDDKFEKLSEELRKAFVEVGFVYLKNTGIHQEENWPSEGVEDFRDGMVSFFNRCKDLSLRVLRVMSIGLGLEPKVFLEAHKHIGSDKNDTTLRTLYYPPLKSDVSKPNQLRCGEHSDYGSITLLFQSPEGGLQVFSRTGEYISIPAISGTVVVNIADLMQRWTSDVYVSSVHRVLLPTVSDSRTRQSLAFFVHPDNEAIISCCDGSDKYPPVKSIDYLLSRFKDSYG